MAATTLPLKSLKKTFDLLRQDPQHLYLTVPATETAPEAVLDLNKITELLWDIKTDPAIANNIWAEIIRQARVKNSGWTVVACGLAGPALMSKTRMLEACFPGTDRAEAQAEVVEGFLVALRTIDLDDLDIESLAGALATKAFNKARVPYREAVGDLADLSCDGLVSGPPCFPVGHPDIVLARAVRAGVITVEEAEYIGRTRLEERSLEDVGAELDVPTTTLFRWRAAAEARLAESLSSGVI